MSDSNVEFVIAWEGRAELNREFVVTRERTERNYINHQNGLSLDWNTPVASEP